MLEDLETQQNFNYPRDMKKIKILLSILISIRWITPFISFWQTPINQEPCTTCSSSPETLLLVNNFISEMLLEIRTVWTAAPYAGKFVPPSRFDTGKFVGQKQSILTKGLKRAKQSLWSVLAIRRIYGEFWDGVETVDSLVVIARNKTILRDWQKLEKIDELINKKKYELSVWWGRTDKIGGVPYQNMEKIIKKYQDLWVLTKDSSKINEGAEYGDLIILLWRINSSMKHLVALQGENRAEKEKKIIIVLLTRGRISFKIQESAIEKIKTAYDCTKRYTCEQSRTNAKDELKKIKDTFKDGLKRSSEQFKIANDKLKKAYSRENIKKSIREENTIVNQLSWSINKLWRKFETKENKTNETTSWTSEPNNQSNTKNEDSSWTTRDGIENRLQIAEDKQAIIDNFISKIEKTQATIRNEATTMEKEYRTTDISDIMAYFTSLSQVTKGITENIIGSKDSEKDCLIKNLWDLCEKQCINIGSKKCYY